MKLLIVGCGYVGFEVAKRFLESKYQDPVVYALTRTGERAGELSDRGIIPVVGDWLDDPLDLPQVDRLLVSVPHRAARDLGEQTHVRGLQRLVEALKLIEALRTSPPRILYLSTTGVYGSNEGLVDESTPADPTREGPKIALAAETWLRKTIKESVSLRLAGIYGPGRIPLAAKIRAGEPLAVPRSGHLNLVHVADIASVICRMLGSNMQHQLYVLSDGQPVVREEFYRRLARLCGVESPAFVDPAEDDSRSRRATDKRVDPTRIIGELDYQFQFPDFRSGLVNSIGE